MSQVDFFLKELYEKYNYIKQVNNSELKTDYTNLIQKFNTYKLENTNDRELYTQSNINNDNLYMLINEYKLLKDKYNNLYFKNDDNNINLQIYDIDFLPPLNDNKIEILSIIDLNTNNNTIIVKIIFNKKYYALKLFKTKKKFSMEYNIHRYLENNEFKQKCENIFINYNFCKKNDYNLIDKDNLLNNFYTEYFILMDYYDGDLFTLLQKSEHIEYCYIIKEFLLNTIKSIYFNNFYYTDFKLENFLYKIDDDNNIEIKLCDLGGFFWDLKYDISYTNIYTNISCVMYNILQKKQFNLDKNTYTNLDLKKMMLHSFCTSIILLYSSDPNILYIKNVYDREIEYIISIYIKDFYNSTYLNSDQLYFKYKLYINYLSNVINTFFKNIFYSNIQLTNIVNLTKSLYEYNNEYDLDNYFFNFIY